MSPRNKRQKTSHKHFCIDLTKRFEQYAAQTDEIYQSLDETLRSENTQATELMGIDYKPGMAEYRWSPNETQDVHELSSWASKSVTQKHQGLRDFDKSTETAIDKLCNSKYFKSARPEPFARSIFDHPDKTSKYCDEIF